MTRNEVLCANNQLMSISEDELMLIDGGRTEGDDWRLFDINITINIGNNNDVSGDVNVSNKGTGNGNSSGNGNGSSNRAPGEFR